jgi:proteasome lid subunit RPN8/RPN11
MLIFTDSVIATLGNVIASREPEVGGALLGVPHSNVVTAFIADPEAQTTGVSYRPSPRLVQEVRAAELRDGLEFRGVVHSHPGGMNFPSSQDVNAFSVGLALNPHLAAFVAPIITVDRPAEEADESQLSLAPRGRMTCYVARRRSEAGGGPLHYEARESLTLRKEPVGLMPIDADVQGLVQGLAREDCRVLRHSEGYQGVNGSLFISRTLRCEQFELYLLFSPHYPLLPPIVMHTDARTQDLQQVGFAWLLSNSEYRLSGCQRAALAVAGVKVPLPSESRPNDEGERPEGAERASTTT